MGAPERRAFACARRGLACPTRLAVFRRFRAIGRGLGADQESRQALAGWIIQARAWAECLYMPRRVQRIEVRRAIGNWRMEDRPCRLMRLALGSYPAALRVEIRAARGPRRSSILIYRDIIIFL